MRHDHPEKVQTDGIWFSPWRENKLILLGSAEQNPTKSGPRQAGIVLKHDLGLFLFWQVLVHELSEREAREQHLPPRCPISGDELVWYECEENLEQSRITNWNHAAPCVGPLALAGGGLHRD